MDFTLSNGVHIPVAAFGTYKSTAEPDLHVLEAAIQCGYRHFDTAYFYFNEDILGRAIAQSGIPREEFFITSKVWKTDMGFDTTIASFQRSLAALQTSYIDLFLIHWPRADLNDPHWQELDLDTWRALETLYKEKKVRAIGTSNFLPHHLSPLMKKAEILPMVDQFEFHPGYTQWETVLFCKEHHIQPEGWSPLGRKRIMSHPLLCSIAQRMNITVAQLCLAFAVQSGVLPLPKSSSPERMKENMDAVHIRLSDEDYRSILEMEPCGWGGEHPDRERVFFNK